MPLTPADSNCQYSTSQNFVLTHRPVSKGPTFTASQLEAQEGESLRRQPLANDWNLRGRLGLGNWKCGRSTGPGTTCPKPILLKNRENIDSILSSMILLCQQSLELTPKLEILAQIAHCGSHQRKDPHDNRKTKWASAFPAQKKDILYLEVHIMEVFEPASSKCPAIKTEKVLCEKRIGGRKVQEYRKQIGDILQLNTYSKDSCMDHLLEVLEKNIYCRDHELTTPLKRRDSWKSNIMEILANVKSDSKNSSHSHGFVESQRQTAGFGASSHREAPDSSYQEISTLGAPPSVNIDKLTALSWLQEFDSTPFRILPRKNKRDKETLNAFIQRKIEADLVPLETKPGYIYVFEAAKVQGFIKIGYTTRAVAGRLENLQFECNRRLKMLFPMPSDTVLIPNAYRVEKLCHAELVDQQVHIDCTGCLQEHHEWFRTSSENAIAVIKKWSAWMNSEPYDPALRRLKDRERSRISTCV